MANGNITFPEVINNFNVYNSGNKMVGVSGEISLADLQAVTAEVSGADFNPRSREGSDSHRPLSCPQI